MRQRSLYTRRIAPVLLVKRHLADFSVVDCRLTVKTDSPLEAAARKLKVALKDTIGLRGIKRVKVLSGPASGVTMYLDFAGQTPMYLGMYEWELHRFFRRTLGAAKLIFDVGGHIGYHALLFAANSQGRVVTFESDPSRVKMIERNIACNPHLASRVSVTHAAIGGNDDVAATLDHVTKLVGAPDFIKIDIDGGELDALLGATRLLRNHRPNLVVETHSPELERACGALLEDCGYRPVIKHNRRVWREHRGGIPHNRWLLAAGKPDL